MYLDMKLASLQAVQTLSRLNRRFGHNKPTFVLDFRNTIEDVKQAFRPYYWQNPRPDAHHRVRRQPLHGIVMTDSDARQQATRHFFKRAQRQAVENQAR